MFAIEVEAGDLIRVPRGTHHWFDLCADRRIRAIRLFQDPSGWTPHYTQSGVDQGFQPVCFGPAYFPARRSAGSVTSRPPGADAVLLDIEGTTTPISFVHDVLFPYARARLEPFCATRGHARRCSTSCAKLAGEHACRSSRRAKTLQRWTSRRRAMEPSGLRSPTARG